MDINQVKERQIGRTDHASAGAEHLLADDNYQEPARYREEHEEDPGDIAEEEPAESGECDPVLTYVGNWTITFYCACSECCGDFATGCTASGVAATSWHTVATDQFPFGTELYVDGLGYFVVEDLGVSGEWLDVFVNDHQEALNLGLQYRDVYVVGGE